MVSSLLQSIFDRKKTMFTAFREILISLIIYMIGCYGPHQIILPIFFNGDINMRPIPYIRLKNSGDLVLDLSLSHEAVFEKNMTITSNTLLMTCVYIPVLMTILMSLYLYRSSIPNSSLKMNKSRSSSNQISSFNHHHVPICCILFSIGLEEFICQILKFYVGRLRPNFYALCGFNEETLQCENDLEREARMSFPSGHSALSFASMSVLSLLFLGFTHLHVNERRTSFFSLFNKKTWILISFSPLIYATFVSTSRLVDNWHHPSDVVAGILLGLVTGFLSCYIWLADYFSPFLLNSTNYNTVLHSIDSLSDEEELPILSKSKITTSSAVGKSTSTTSGSYV